MPTIGEILRQARKKKGLSLDEVHVKTKITYSILEALENNSAESIVDFIYAKNFLKQYAQLLGLDSNDLTARFQIESMPRTLARPLGVMLQQPKGGKGKSTRVIFSVVIIIALVIAIFFTTFLFKRGKSQTDTNIAIPIGYESDTITDNSLSAAYTLPLRLQITTSGQVWVQIKADGNIVFQGILANNIQESWQANDNFELWLGKPDVVVLSLNGQRLDLPKGKKIKGAKITQNGLQF